MNTLKHIPDISCYNNNYYVGLNKEIVFGKSDDDGETEWLIINEHGRKLIGYTDGFGGHNLQLSDKYRT